ncbi:hypothetical protein Bca52824_010546 [Brassica carinata]|uniref:Uncharacterized protein n=1 Tax=Brassica carinata TaxID=52824 RepID=A0A8X8BAY6_BRACI|nr:hypothetical protein Bca52824_010546 [Brassica carinata]
MEDERVNLLLDMIRNKFEWSNTEWPAIEPEETEIEETNTKDIDSEAGKSVDDTNVVEDEEISLVKVVGKGRRKVHDEGAETRKKKLLCKRSAEKNRVLIVKLRVSLRVSSIHLSLPWGYAQYADGEYGEDFYSEDGEDGE